MIGLIVAASLFFGGGGGDDVHCLAIGCYNPGAGNITAEDIYEVTGCDNPWCVVAWAERNQQEPEPIVIDPAEAIENAINSPAPVAPDLSGLDPWEVIQWATNPPQPVAPSVGDIIDICFG